MLSNGATLHGVVLQKIKDPLPGAITPVSTQRGALRQRATRPEPRQLHAVSLCFKMAWG
jgi:hypothetical protein